MSILLRLQLRHRLLFLIFLIDTIQGKTLKDKIVYDRCPLDAVAYTMWANGKGIEGFTDEFVEKQITMSKEALRSLDIIFMTRFNEDIMKVEDDGTRDANLEFIKEMDNIFYSLYMQYMVHLDADVFYPKGDSPCVILLPDPMQGSYRYGSRVCYSRRYNVW